MMHETRDGQAKGEDRDVATKKNIPLEIFKYRAMDNSRQSRLTAAGFI